MTRQQTWARRAHERVAAVGGITDDSAKSKYKTMCVRFPSLLVQSGLVQALHFLERDKVWHPYLDDLAYVLVEQQGRDVVLKQAREAKLTDYMALAREVGGAAQWMRRIAQGELAEVDVPKGDD